MKMTKVITILAALTLLTAMAGIAVAQTGFLIDPDSFTVPDEGVFNGVTVTWQGTSSTTANWYIQKYTTTWVATTEMVAKIATDDDSSYISSGAQTFAPNQPILYLIKDIGQENSKVNDQYRIRFEDDGGDFRVTSKASIAVPEFATIALPAVAILGLFVFFNHRKRK